MPIQIKCSTCEKSFKVKDSFAGKKIRCPKCKKGVIQVPAAGSTPAATQQAAPQATPTPTPTPVQPTAAPTGAAAINDPNTQWHLKTEDGEIYGPIPRTELDEWMAEGRVTAECQVIIDGDAQWKWATDLYPQLEQPAAGGGASDNPFDFAASGGGASAGVSVSTGGTTGATGSTSTKKTPEGVSDKSKLVAGLLAIFLGSVGVHRFYLGYTGLGIAMICCCGGCGWWQLFDVIMIFTGKLPDADGRPLKD